MQIVLCGLDRLVVSFDGMSQEAYSSYRRSGDLEKVKHHIGLINQAKKTLKRKNPHVVLQYLITRNNEKFITAPGTPGKGKQRKRKLKSL